MKVFIVVEHIDRGSDEFRIKGVFSTEEGAAKFIVEDYIEKGWQPMIEEGEDITDFDTIELEYFQDGDEMNDSVSVEIAEVQ